MIAQVIFSLLLGSILLYAWTEHRRSPVVALLSFVMAAAGVYFVWVPAHSTVLAEFVGIGRGVDLVLYTWVAISLIILLNLHLKLRAQLELMTVLARKMALASVDVRPGEGLFQPGATPLSALTDARVSPRNPAKLGEGRSRRKRGRSA
jgi:small membrane protein